MDTIGELVLSCGVYLDASDPRERKDEDELAGGNLLVLLCCGPGTMITGLITGVPKSISESSSSKGGTLDRSRFRIIGVTIERDFPTGNAGECGRVPCELSVLGIICSRDGEASAGY